MPPTICAASVNGRISLQIASNPLIVDLNHQPGEPVNTSATKKG